MYTCYGFIARLGHSAVVAGALFTLLFAWNVTQSVWRVGSETKHTDQATHPTAKSVTMEHDSTLEHSVFSVMAELIVGMLFSTV